MFKLWAVPFNMSPISFDTTNGSPVHSAHRMIYLLFEFHGGKSYFIFQKQKLCTCGFSIVLRHSDYNNRLISIVSLFSGTLCREETKGFDDKYTRWKWCTWMFPPWMHYTVCMVGNKMAGFEGIL